MLHLLFLLASLALVALEQVLLLRLLPKIWGWRVRQGLQLVALGMPLVVIIIFTITMLPTVLTPEYYQKLNLISKLELLFGVLGIGLLIIPILLTLLSNLVRLAWLYFETFKQTWAAPRGMNDLVNRDQPIGKGPLKIRLWNSARPFAFNLPGFFLKKGVIVISTGLISELEENELQAVIWHEQSHLVRHDFWTNWFGTWWATGFFYMPAARPLLELLKKDQELACDEKVARFGGTRLALALAEALLKVWEKLLVVTQKETMTSKKGFQAPGLATENLQTLTEQRVTRLIEFSKPDSTAFFNGKTTLFSKPFLALVSSQLLGAALTWLIHLLCPDLG